MIELKGNLDLLTLWLQAEADPEESLLYQRSDSGRSLPGRIGFAIAPNDGGAMKHLIPAADTAIYRAINNLPVPPSPTVRNCVPQNSRTRIGCFRA